MKNLISQGVTRKLILVEDFECLRGFVTFGELVDLSELAARASVDFSGGQMNSQCAENYSKRDLAAAYSRRSCAT
jgi:hypothetical protein